METRRAMAYMANGGRVPGKGKGDTVPAMLTPGEFVMPKDSVRSIGAAKLMAMNAATHKPSGKKAPPGHYRDGGIVEEIPPRSVTQRPNFTIPGMQPTPAPTLRLPAPQPGADVAASTRPNFTRPGIDSPLPQPPAVNPNVQDVRPKFNPANASPEAKAFMDGRAATAAAPAESVMAQAPKVARAGILDADVGAMALRAGGGAARLAGTVLNGVGRVAAPLALGAQAVQTANTSTDNYANRIGAEPGQSFAGDVAARAVGTMQDIGNAATFGLADRVGNAIAGNGFGHSTAYGSTDDSTAAAKMAASPQRALPPGVAPSAAGAGRGSTNPYVADPKISPTVDVNKTVSLNGQPGAAVDGAPGVSKFKTASGQTLYSNVTGTDNDKLMSGKPGVQTVPSLSGGQQGNAQMAMSGGSPNVDAALSAARYAAAARGDWQAVSDSYRGDFAGGEFAPKTAQQLLAQQIQRDVAGGKRITKAGAEALTSQQNADSTASHARTAQQHMGLQTAEFGVRAPGEAAKSQDAIATQQAKTAYTNAIASGDPAQVSAAEERLRGQTLHFERNFPDLFDKVQTGLDPATGAPIFSIYNKRTGEPKASPQTPAPPEGTRVRGKDGKNYVVKNGQPVLEK